MIKSRPLSYLFLLIPVIAGILSSCDDIIEPDISKVQIEALAPANNYQSTSYTINFWWNPVDHALSYHLQVVTPNFAAPGSLVLDTVITTYKFTSTLSPGNYQWRVMAENGSSQTAWSSSLSFTVLASSITQQAVQLSSPGNNFITNQNSVVFQWGSLYGATQYEVQIDTNNFANPATVVSNQVIPGQQLSFTFPKNQVYQWRVMAQNDTAKAQWSQVNQVTFDNIPPGQVTLVSPASGVTVSSPVSLQWNTVATAVKYKLYVYQSDGVTIYNSSFPMVLTANSYSFSLGNSGDKIYWMVTAVDAAGNESQASAINNFTLQ